jgi:co-chaperonin GroES (HSP10)
MQSTKPRIEPLGAFLVVKLEDDANKFRELIGREPSEIELPGKIQGKMAIALIQSAGPGHYRADGQLQPMDLKPGERVLIMRAGLMPIDPNDDNVVLCLANNAVAKIVSDG